MLSRSVTKSIAPKRRSYRHPERTHERSGMTDTTRRHVLLLHGIWMVGATLRWFGARLRAAGHVPEIFGYHSIVGGPQAAVPRLVQRLREGPPADIVAHSLGGLIALQALAEVPELPAARV